MKSEQLIKIEFININSEIIHAVNARLLHENLNAKRKFSDWLPQQIKMFQKDVDYIIFEEENSHFQVTKKNHGNIKNECFLTLDTAKHIAMMSRCKRGKELRQYFIDVEKKFTQILKQQTNAAWQQARLQGKKLRLRNL